MNAQLSPYGTPVEHYPDGSRELTKAERIAQIGWEISAEQLERAARVAEIHACEIDQRAGDTFAGNRIARCRQNIAGADARIANLRYELNNLLPVNPPRADEE